MDHDTYIRDNDTLETYLTIPPEPIPTYRIATPAYLPSPKILRSRIQLYSFYIMRQRLKGKAVTPGEQVGNPATPAPTENVQKRRKREFFCSILCPLPRRSKRVSIPALSPHPANPTQNDSITTPMFTTSKPPVPPVQKLDEESDAEGSSTTAAANNNRSGGPLKSTTTSMFTTSKPPVPPVQKPDEESDAEGNSNPAAATTNSSSTGPLKLGELLQQEASDLWTKAYNDLPIEYKQELECVGNTDGGKPEKLEALLELAMEAKRKNVESQWKLKWGGKEINVREKAEKLVGWIEKFKEVVNIAVQYDPVHATLPWAGVRFILIACLSQLLILKATYLSCQLLT